MQIIDLKNYQISQTHLTHKINLPVQNVLVF